MLTHTFSAAPAAQVLQQDNTLAVIPLVNQCEPFEPGIICTGIEAASDTQLCEIWSVKGRVTHGRAGQSVWTKSDDVICVAHWLTKDDCKQIEANTQQAYTCVLNVLKEHGFLYPFRFWNYLPGINVGDGDKESYKKFCTGRLKAFEQVGIQPDAFPSASALGHHNEGAVFYVFASTIKPRHFTNNKQVNAYEYPRQYGVSSPSFARATALTLQNKPYLFISGTASIIGHQTVESGNLERQLEVTMANIEHLLTTANPDNRSLSTFKVYVRHDYHVKQTREWLEKRYPDVKAIYTIADICRKDLLVEIECFCQ